MQELGHHEALVFFADRTWQTIGSRDTGLAELVLRDTVNELHTDVPKES
jgi:hypothetical protein